MSSGPEAGTLKEWPCEPEDAAEVGTDPLHPGLLALTWPEDESGGGGSTLGPGRSPSSSKPEVLQFAHTPSGDFITMQDPLWRRAISEGG